MTGIALPDDATKANLDSGSDAVKNARTELALLVDKFNLLKAEVGSDRLQWPIELPDVVYASATSFTTSNTSGCHAGRRLQVVGTTTGTVYATIESVSGSTLALSDITDASDAAATLSSESLSAWLGAMDSESAATGVVTDNSAAYGSKLYNRINDIDPVTDHGAKGDGSTDDTASVQTTSDAQIADANAEMDLYFPPGKFMLDTVSIDLSQSAHTDHVNIHGHGQASTLISRSNPSQTIFEFTGTGSFSTMLHGFRVGVSTQGNNVASPLVKTASGTTILDFQFYDLYINGLPRGFQGQFVSGVFSNIIFDFMTDYGIYAPNKEFRKIEIVGDHFYKVKDSCILVDGSLDTAGGATTQTNRDETQSAGHIAVVGCGFDRYYDVTVQQKMVKLTQLDNFVLAGDWFNGKTPAETDTGTHDALDLVSCDNFSAGALSAYYMDRGFSFNSCTNFAIGPITIRKGNLSAGASTGAVRLVDCEKFRLTCNIQESAGTGLYMSGCKNGVVHVTCTKSQLSGVVASSCEDVWIYANVVDANQADSAVGVEETSAVFVTGTVGSPSRRVFVVPENIAVSDVSQGQKAHIYFATNTEDCRVLPGRVGAARTGNNTIVDGGTRTRIGRVTGFINTSDGTAGITNPATSVTVSHGLDIIPSISDIDVRLTDAAAGVTRFWVSNITATDFDINVDTTPTSGANFVWKIDGSD